MILKEDGHNMMEFCVSLLLLTAVVVVWWRGRQIEEAPNGEEDGREWERCCRQAQMANFWTYDGTEQADAEELAQALYRKREGRGQR